MFKWRPTSSLTRFDLQQTEPSKLQEVYEKTEPNLVSEFIYKVRQ